jgi:hypothetical protein
MITSLLTIWIGQVPKHFEIEFTLHPADGQVKIRRFNFKCNNLTIAIVIIKQN